MKKDNYYSVLWVKLIYLFILLWYQELKSTHSCCQFILKTNIYPNKLVKQGQIGDDHDACLPFLAINDEGYSDVWALYV